MTTETKTDIDFTAITTFRLDTWQAIAFEEIRSRKTGEDVGHRYFHTLDGDKIRSVTVTRDMRIACTCPAATIRIETGEGDVCEHIAEALDYVDTVGFRRLSTRKLSGKVA